MEYLCIVKNKEEDIYFNTCINILSIMAEKKATTKKATETKATAAKKTETVNGRFEVCFDPMEAIDKTTLIVKSKKLDEEICFRDIAIGEVWLAGGQSNMEYLMHTDAERDKEKERLSALSEEKRASIRFFDYPEISYEGMEEIMDFSNFGKWRCLAEEDLPYFSAVSYYFERKIEEMLDCPVGVIGCNWGGTRACCWMPEESIREAGGEVWIREYEEGLKAIPDIEKALAVYKKGTQNVVTDPAAPVNPFTAIVYPGFPHQEQKKMEEMMAGAGDDAAFMMAILPIHPWRPSGLYHTMLQKVMPYTIRGFIYYQGCSDDIHADIYADMMKALIKRWRADFDSASAPFIMVQLAPFGEWLGNSGTEYPAVREAQLRAADETENVWTASIGDAGMIYDIHPKHKRKPGERLGLLALKYVYGKEVEADAPRAKEMVYDGDTAVIRFENGGGLHLQAPENGGFTEEEKEAIGFNDPDVPESLGAEENLKALIETVPAGDVAAEIRDDTLRISVIKDGQAVKPETVRFAWTPYYEINVYNEAGLPVYPFEIRG